MSVNYSDQMQDPNAQLPQRTNIPPSSVATLSGSGQTNPVANPFGNGQPLAPAMPQARLSAMPLPPLPPQAPQVEMELPPQPVQPKAKLTPEEFQRQKEELVAQYSPNRGGFINSAIGSVGNTLAGAGRAVEDATNPGIIQNLGKGVRTYGEHVEAMHPPTVQSLDQIPEHPGKFVSESLGQMGGQALQAVGGAAIGSAIGGGVGLLGGPLAPVLSPALAAAGGYVGANLPTALGEYGGIRQQQEQQGITDLPRAAGGALTNTAIENLGGFTPSGMAKAVLKPGKIAEEVAQKFAGMAPKQALKEIAKAGVKSGLEESAEETAQNPISQWAAHQNPLEPANLAETAFGAASAFPGGALFGGGRRTYQGLNGKPEEATPHINDFKEAVASGKFIDMNDEELAHAVKQAEALAAHPDAQKDEGVQLAAKILRAEQAQRAKGPTHEQEQANASTITEHPLAGRATSHSATYHDEQSLDAGYGTEGNPTVQGQRKSGANQGLSPGSALPANGNDTGTPPAQDGQPHDAIGALTPEAHQYLADASKGVPVFVSKNLKRIATENGVPVTKDTTAKDIVAQLQAKRDAVQTVDEAAHAAAASPLNDKKEPTEAQAKAGNYGKGHVNLSGIDISIENPASSTRKGIDANGKPWQTTLQDHYGYFKGTVGKDKDHVDTFIKPGTPTDYDGPVFVVDQKKPGNGHFDEHKVVIGAEDQQEAENLYKRNYTSDWDGIRAITPMSMDGLKDWLKNGDTTKPAAEHAASTQESNNASSIPSNEKEIYGGGRPLDQSGGVSRSEDLQRQTETGTASSGIGGSGETQGQRENGAAQGESSGSTGGQGQANQGARTEQGGSPDTQAISGANGEPSRSDNVGESRTQVALSIALHGKDHVLVSGDTEAHKAKLEALGGKAVEGGYRFPKFSYNNLLKHLNGLVATPAKTENAVANPTPEAINQANDEKTRTDHMAGGGTYLDGQSAHQKNPATDQNQAPVSGGSKTETSRSVSSGSQQEQGSEAAQGAITQANKPAAMSGQALAPETERTDKFKASAQKYKDKFNSAYAKRDEKSLANQMMLSNPVKRAEFEARTGIKLPTKRDEITQAVSAWAKTKPTSEQSGTKADNLIMGHTWDEIKAMQQRAYAGRPIKHQPLPMATEADIEQLRQQGIEGLKEKQFNGVIDRLQNSGIVPKETAVESGETAKPHTQTTIQEEGHDQATHAATKERQQQAQEVASESKLAKEPSESNQPIEKHDVIPLATQDKHENNAPKSSEAIADTAKIAQAKADLDDALADLGQFFLDHNLFTKKVVPSEFDDARLMPIMARVMDAAIRLGHAKFINASRFVLDTVRDKFGDRAADSITLEQLQGGYIAVVGKYKDSGTDSKRAVIDIESLEDVKRQETDHDNEQAKAVRPGEAGEVRALAEQSGQLLPEAQRNRTNSLRETEPTRNAGVLGVQPPENVQNAQDQRSSDETGLRPGVQGIRSGNEEPGNGNVVHGREGAGGTGLANTRSRRRN